ncbi:MAG TPA: ornithine carbamoyltransferase [Chloroflexota bacterium]|nr:ornithine carbamoyltransferase [Chloroflexota bacterium]
MKDLLRTANLNTRDIEMLLDLSTAFREKPLLHNDSLQGRSVVQFYAKHSTRTRISFETAVARLGGITITTGPNDLQLGRGETIEDTARTISQFASAFIIRTFEDADVQRFAQAASIPVINALTNGHHPCQSLADMLTIRDRFGSFSTCRLAYVGDGYNVAHSLIEASALLGMEIAVATPPRYEPDASVVAWSRAQAERTGARIILTNDPVEAVTDAHAVYTDVWFSMGDSELERASRVATFLPYRVTTDLMAHARPNAIFMHCLPAHRGEEVTAEVIDGPRSIVFEQAANRLYTAQAVIHALVRGLLRGSGESVAPVEVRMR